jgi:hypothetical protein
VGLNNDGSPAFLDEFQSQFPGQKILLQVKGDGQYRLIFCVLDPDPIRIQPDPERPKWYSKTGENEEISCLTSNLYGAEKLLSEPEGSFYVFKRTYVKAFEQ